MSPQQATAFKLSILWIELNRREFPDRRQVKLRKNGDPRKSMLFRQCFKLVQETQGLIKPEEYKLYILAQLRTIGKMEVDGIHALIEPSILTGPKAWKRWKNWKWHYDKRMKQSIPDGKELNNVLSPILVIQQLENTKKFLDESSDSISAAIQTGKFKEWIKMEKISPFYVLLSPLVKFALAGKNANDTFDKDFSIYESSISPEVNEYFQKNFQHEIRQDRDSYSH